MEINEKCDVYSFGVLTLEVIMGKHPGDFVLSLLSASSSSFSASQSTTHHDISLKDIMDPRLPFPTNKQVAEKMVLVAKLALLCVDPNPQLRPTMRQISDQFLKQRPYLQGMFPTITIAQLLALQL